MDAVLTEIAPVVTRRKLLISIAAGVSTAKIRALLREDARLIRVMPNTPALVLEGATAIAKADGLEAGDLDTAGEIFSAVGRVVVLGEDLMDAVTVGFRTRVRRRRDRVAGRRGGADGPRPGHGDDSRDPDGPGRREAPAGDRDAPGSAQGHGLLAGRNLDRRCRRPRRRRAPHDVHQGGRAGDPALARARARDQVMFVINYFFIALANLLNLAIVVYIWIIIARAILSWVSPDPYNPLVRFVYRATEPVLRPVRERLSGFQLGLDFSPMIVILVLYFLKEFLVPVLYRIATEIG
jgi:YggT family protein